MHPRVPLILRGEILELEDIEHAGRRDGGAFMTVDPKHYVDRLTLDGGVKMSDLHGLKFADTVDYLESLGRLLQPSRNPHVRSAFEALCCSCALPNTVLRRQYELLPDLFCPEFVREMTERAIGGRYLDGWVDQWCARVSQTRTRVRAFGARAIHIIAGNVPAIGALTLVRNAITRSDALIKLPSNDPHTTTAIVRTMIEMAPDHPLTRHVAVAYWKGGDEAIESHLFNPRRVEKIVAWGGVESIRHSIRHLQPGIELISLEPKHSISIVGAEAFADDESLREAAGRLAHDIGALNQEACFSCRVAFAVCGTGATAIKKAHRLAQLTFDALQRLPAEISAAHQRPDPLLKSEVDALRLAGTEYAIFGGRANEGAIVVSHDCYPVDFASSLSCRTANIVPVGSLDVAIAAVSSSTQTVGVYPESLALAIRDELACQGAQRLVSLGSAASIGDATAPAQDGIEPLRRMCRWITHTSGQYCSDEALHDTKSATAAVM